MLLCLVSAKGSPGVTTSAVALAVVWHAPVLVAECDPAGGDLHAGALAAAAGAARGLFGLAIAARDGGPARHLPVHVVPLDPGYRTMLLPGIAHPAQAAQLGALWEPLADAFRGLTWPARAQHREPVDVIADCGRLGHYLTPWPLLRAADLVALVCRSSLAAVHAAACQVDALRGEIGAAPGPLVAVMVGHRHPFTVREVTRAIGVDVAGVLRFDPRTAAVFNDGAPARYGMGGSTYLRTARRVGDALRARASAQTTRTNESISEVDL